MSIKSVDNEEYLFVSVDQYYIRSRNQIYGVYARRRGEIFPKIRNRIEVVAQPGEPINIPGVDSHGSTVPEKIVLIRNVRI